MNNSKHIVAKSIVRIFYVALIFASKSSISVSQLIIISSACILLAPVADYIVDKISSDDV